MQLLRYLGALLCVVYLSALSAQPAEDSLVVQARSNLQRVTALAAAGNLPQSEVLKAEDGLADAQDAAILRQDIYRQDLTDSQADELVAAAGRQLERRKRAFDSAKQLVDLGVAPQVSLDTVLRDLNFARTECDLAESRARLAREMTQQAEVEAALAARLAQAPSEASKTAERFDGNGLFNQAVLQRIEGAFQTRFGKALPISAIGETAVHRALGFDHRGRVDVAVSPDQPEGVWLRAYLAENRIPFFAFWQAVPGKATGAHIHLGPVSTRLAATE